MIIIDVLQAGRMLPDLLLNEKPSLTINSRQNNGEDLAGINGLKVNIYCISYNCFFFFLSTQ